MKTTTNTEAPTEELSVLCLARLVHNHAGLAVMFLKPHGKPTKPFFGMIDGLERTIREIQTHNPNHEETGK